jgi:hypothetical protein
MQIDETLLFGGEKKLQLRSLEIGANRISLFAAATATAAECGVSVYVPSSVR